MCHTPLTFRNAGLVGRCADVRWEGCTAIAAWDAPCHALHRRSPSPKKGVAITQTVAQPQIVRPRDRHQDTVKRRRTLALSSPSCAGPKFTAPLGQPPKRFNQIWEKSKARTSRYTARRQ